MAKIDTSKIEGFDKLSAEEKVKVLMGYEFEDNSSELASIKDALEKQKKATDKASSEAADFKRQLREKQSEGERAEADRNAELERLRAENENFKLQSQMAEYKANAISMGYSEELAAKRAKAMVEGNFSEMASVDKQFLEAHDKEMKANAVERTSQPPVGGSGGGNGTVTAEQFKQMGYSEMVALHDSNPELYAELSKA